MGMILVFFQVGSFLILLFLSDLVEVYHSALNLLLVVCGLAFSFWGYISMGIANYSPIPKPRKNGDLVTSGPYGLVRHPIYSGFMITGFIVWFVKITFLTTVVYAVFLFVTVVKANIEERLLRQKYDGYDEYKNNVSKYVPFLDQFFF